MHVDHSFSYLRSAEAASFDKKSSTGTAQSRLFTTWWCSVVDPERIWLFLGSVDPDSESALLNQEGQNGFHEMKKELHVLFEGLETSPRHF
jgi:hypothetical protein